MLLQLLRPISQFFSRQKRIRLARNGDPQISRKFISAQNRRHISLGCGGWDNKTQNDGDGNWGKKNPETTINCESCNEITTHTKQLRRR